VRVVRTCVVEVVGGKDAGKRGRLERPCYRVGSGEGNDLVLSDETVSQQHLEVNVEPDGFRIVDLGSSNGTYAGSAKVGELTVVEETLLQLGETSLRITPTQEEAEVPTSEATSFGKVLGTSVAMRELFEQLEAVAPSDCAVLLEGETGVGKELVAESLHEQSRRAAGPFVVVDCGALAASIIEGELFGHVRGAYTGADSERAGLLEEANGGTLFLDEVGELPLGLQSKLLGALERKVVRRLGANESRPLDLRVIAATNRNLAREVNEKRFRADLFFRLSVVRLRIPPLRERLSDLPVLAHAFLDGLRARYGDALPPSLSALALAKLAAQPWPGNVRQLRNAVERVALQTDRDAEREEPFSEMRAKVLDEFERNYFKQLLAEHGSSLRNVARESQLDRRYLQRILRRHGLTSS
jgi:two-component system, NtrC family, nitrogen regulation response regulator GlnG